MEKTCVQHADAPAVASCKVCEKSLCLMCTTEVAGDIFCSPKCADVFSEVKDWIEPKAAPEEWNPLADTGSTFAQQLPEDDTALEMPSMPPPGDTTLRGRSLPEDESMLDLGRMRPPVQPPLPEPPAPEPPEAEPLPEPALTAPAESSLPQDESLLDLGRMAAPSDPVQPPEVEKTCVQHPDAKAVGACTKCGTPFCGTCGVDTSWGTFCTVECSVGYQGASTRTPSLSKKLMPALLGVAAVALLVVGFVILSAPPPKELPAVAKTEPAKIDPIPSEPLKPLPKPEPLVPDPVVPTPPKTEPATAPPATPAALKPEPAKPEPLKPVPPTPVVLPKVDPPKADPIRPQPAKPEPAPSQPPKPEPVKPQPSTPEPVRPETPKPESPKPAPVRPEPPKPVVVAKVDPPKPPEPAKPAEPPRHRLLARDPWMGEKAGAWYRVRTTKDGKETYTDIGLKEHGPWYVVLQTQTWTAGKPEPVRQEYIELGELSPVRLERVMRRGVTHDFEVLEPKTGKGPWKWVTSGDRYSGASLPEDWVTQKVEPVGFGEQSLRVKDREFDCLILESRTSKVWISPTCPIGEVKREGNDGLREIVDLGTEWSKRVPPLEPPMPGVIAKADPPRTEPVKPETPKPETPKAEPPKPEPAKPPPPKPEPVKPEPKPEPPKEDPQVRVKKSLDQAALLIRQSTPLFREIADGMEAGLTERPQLQALLDKVQDVHRRLTEARQLYSEVKDEAVDPGLIEGRIRKLDSLIETTASCAGQLKSKL
jgi:hypothetical protein